MQVSKGGKREEMGKVTPYEVTRSRAVGLSACV